MMGTAISFAFPAALWALLALPVIWWLLRFTPPRPMRIEFPPFRLLRELVSKEEQPDHTPWWLILLRLVLAALIILSVARPMLGEPATAERSDSPLLIVIDDGWAAAHDWSKRAEFLDQLLREGEASGRQMALATTAPRSEPQQLALGAALQLRQRIAGLLPQALDTDRMALLARLKSAFADIRSLDVVWMSDGIDAGTANDFAKGLASLAGGSARVQAVADPSATLRPALTRPVIESDGIKATILRPSTEAPSTATLRALAGNGRNLLERQVTFAPSDVKRDVTLDLPLELRNELARLEITGERSAGAVQILDDRWKRKAVGVAVGASLELAQPLLSPLYYVTRALEPYAELRQPAEQPSGLRDLIDSGLSVLVLADIGIVPAASRSAIVDWVERGGVLLRFAGPRLAGSHDDLVPVDLRSGGRELGSALSWEAPQSLAPFDERSPFAGLVVDPGIKVNRQVLAEPSADLPDKIWASLQDGTPLITASKRGKGEIVLVHVTANADWSNLPLSGLFVEMLRRILDVAPGAGAIKEAVPGAVDSSAAFAPLRALNGFGELVDIPADAEPIAAADMDKAVPSPRHPAGLYVRAGATRALNLAVSDQAYRAITTLPSGVARAGYVVTGANPLAGHLLTAALVLFILDTLAAMTLSGAWRRLRRAPSVAIVLLAAGVFLFLAGDGARAQQAEPPSDAFAIEATSSTRLAYVRTGNSEVDNITLGGMMGLTSVLAQRTAVEPDAPIAIDIEKDDIVFFPLIYWPVTTDMPVLSEQAVAKIDSFMKNGGTIFFDTRDADKALFSPSGVSPETQALRSLLSRLDIPPIEPVPEGHVLTKSFYLMQTFPGRYSQGQLWVESQNDRSTTPDGVTSIIIGANDYAAAWATDDNGSPLLPVVPGGEDQREFAYRTGINIVMYALTGNYKSDQVHVPALLERLGQ
jgi:hypothetical protein